MAGRPRRRRGHGEGSVYQAPDGRWRGVVDLGWQDGKRKRKYLSGRTREDVVRKLRQAQHTVDSGLPLAAGRTVTFGAWLTTYLDTVAVRRVRPRTLEMYAGFANNRIIPTLGGHRLGKLLPEHLERFYRAMEAEGLAPATILQCHRIISRALKVAMQRGYVARNVATLVDAPSVTRTEVTPPTMEQVRAILDTAGKRRDAARWAVALALGLRQGEALGLTWDSVDLDSETLTVRQALQRQRGKGLVLVEPKSHAGRRTLPLPTFVTAMIRTHRAAQLAERLAAGGAWEDHGLVFCQVTGRPIDPRADHRAWHSLLGDAGVPRYRLHDARHFAATLLLAQGVPARVAMELLGHSQISLTLGTYSHVGRELARDAADRVGAALSAPS